MRPAWRLGISSLSGRRSRTALLVGAVALSAALIAAVACSMASVHASLRSRIESTVGRSDLRITNIGKDQFDLSVAHKVESWPEVQLVVPRLRDALGLENSRTGKRIGTQGNGVFLDKEFELRPLELVEGRTPKTDQEIVLDTRAAELLEAKVGDTLVARKGENAVNRALERIGGVLGDVMKKRRESAENAQAAAAPMSFTVVGISKQPSLGMGIAIRPETVVSWAALRAFGDRGDKISEVDVILRETAAAEQVAKAHEGEFARGLAVRPSAKVTSGLNDQIKQSQVGMAIASMLAYLAASFIIMTGLTTNVNERQRELAMLRCIGASKLQMGESQLVVGAIIGVLGAAIGIPLGALGALILVKSFPEQLPGGFAVNWVSLATAVVGSIIAGLIGAAWPAIRAARTSPLEALGARAKVVGVRGLVICAVVGVALAIVHLTIIFNAKNADQAFWGDITVGLPSMFVGYFVASVPVFVLVARVIGPVLGRLFGLPAGLLHKTVLATPYRFGFTSGAMMMGLALLVAIWTNGRAVMEDWLEQLKFPDAFVAGVAISDSTRQRIADLPFVTDTVAIQTLTMKSTAFGLESFDHTETTFIAFEPEPFFKMTTLQWVDGTPEKAIPRLKQGGAVLVAKEFQTARGTKVGDSITLTYEDKPYTFEVVGVVSSPGLDIVNSWFEIGEDYAKQAVNAVFGSREDMRKLFGVETSRLLQVGLKTEVNGVPVDDKAALQMIKEVGGAGIIDAGSGRQILGEVKMFLSGSLYIFSLVAVGAMAIACFGVANLIVAGIQARQFEFGVLRAVGAQQGLLSRLVLGEAVLIAITACIMGTAMGIHGARAGQRVNELLIGMKIEGWPPVLPTLGGCVAVVLITIAAALPAIAGLNRKKVRELLGAVRG